MSDIEPLVRAEMKKMRSNGRWARRTGNAFIAFGPVWIVACAHATVDSIGVSRMQPHADVHDPASASASVSGAPSTWASASAFHGWKRANARTFTSHGHLFERWQADLFVNDVGVSDYASVGPARRLPEGAVVVEALSRGADVGPIFAMERGPDGWSFVEMDAAGRVLRAGAIAPCVGCHAHVAGQDQLFGVPSDAR